MEMRFLKFDDDGMIRAINQLDAQQHIDLQCRQTVNCNCLAGNRLAIGAPNNDGNGYRSGHVRVYAWSGSAWLQLGEDIDGEWVDD